MSGGPPSDPVKLSAVLQQPDDSLKESFRALQSASDVADLLGLPTRQLTYILWRSPTADRYQRFEIRKRRGGGRTIHAPNRSLRILQQKLAYVLELTARIRSSAHGFQKDKSICTNAACHAKKAFVLNVDLQDSFPSISFARVLGLFAARPYQIGRPAAAALAQLCCHGGFLPQGAPTSPVISNMICARLDGELQRLANRYSCYYTRYADDLTFSTSRSKFPEELATQVGNGSRAIVGSALNGVIQQNSFTVNTEKVRLQRATSRQSVTGLIVNRRPNVRRKFASQIRAMLHAWEKFGYENAEAEFFAQYDTKHRARGHREGLFEHVVRGKLAFLYQVRGPDNGQYQRLRHWLAQLSGEAFVASIPSGHTHEFDVFVVHASEDKEAIVRPLVKALSDAAVKVWVDEGEIKWGDKITANINSGLSKSRFVILVLSGNFLKKNWPTAEMSAVLTKEIKSGITCALPLMCGPPNTRNKILETYPLLADKHFEEWDRADVGRLVSKLKMMIAA